MGAGRPKGVLNRDVDLVIYEELARGPRKIYKLALDCKKEYNVAKRHVESMVRRGIVKKSGSDYAVCSEYSPDPVNTASRALMIAKDDGIVTVGLLAEVAGVTRTCALLTLHRLAARGELVCVIQGQAGRSREMLSRPGAWACVGTEPLEGL